MAAIREQDLAAGEAAFRQWAQAARSLASSAGSGAPADAAARLVTSPDLPRPVWAMAVRFSLFLLERKAPGPSVEVRVAPWAAVKILDGPASDPHNLTPPDVIELDPEVWLRLACGITTWNEEKAAGHISAVGERDDLSALLPLAAV
ncbi:sterol carrier family protein [Bifidobacterium sp.]|uniref:sterol carrier family protein n=1 Tax=Bifidobacterium sp. TaxID=41200 RepID=UPI0025C5EEBB|nr:sterol carrier family protein [Bifidobacterium sp.]MCH4209437.1 sterol carrier family protein [Bifidobacterium sp.]MCI1224877.1 sterol carrier family protein [Bifidobacterium sp.]